MDAEQNEKGIQVSNKTMIEAVTDDERSIIEHSLGIEHKKGRQRKPYRNYYCASAGDARLESLADRGSMKRGRKINEGTDQYYLVTESGAAAVGSKLPKEAD